MLTIEYYDNIINQINDNPNVFINEAIEKCENIINGLDVNDIESSMYQHYIKLKNDIIENPQNFLSKQLVFYTKERDHFIKYINNLKKELNEKINKERNERFYSDVEYNFPDLYDKNIFHKDIIDIRDESDRQCFQDLAIDAQYHIFKGQPNHVCCYMPQSNNLKFMTAEQLLDMVLFLKERGESIYATSWNHKIAISMMQSEEELLNYNYKEGWLF